MSYGDRELTNGFYESLLGLLTRDNSDYPLARLGMGAFRIALEAVYKVCSGPLYLAHIETLFTDTNVVGDDRV